MKFADEGPSWWYQAHFPVDVYPNALERFVVETAESLCVHPDMMATAVLPVAGTLIGNSRWIECKNDGWCEPPKLWAGIVAEPGGKKSPALGRLTGPLRKVEERLEEQHAALVADWEQLPAKGRPEKPKPIRLVVSDITTEALGDRLRSHPRGVLVYRDELSGWLKSLGQYRSREGDDRQQWLELWPNDATLRNDRKTSDSSTILRRAFVSLLGGIQPEKLGLIVGRDGDDGMLDRFLLCAPPLLDEVYGTPPVEKVLREAYGELVEALYGLSAIHVGHRTDPLLVKLDVGGQALAATGFENHYAQKNNLRRQKSPLRGMWGKVDAHVFRVALVLTELWHVCEGGPEVVDEYRMHDAWRVIDFFKNQANRILGPGGLLEPKEYERAGPVMERRVLEWVKRQPEQRASLKQLRQSGPLRTVSVDDARKLLRGMEEQGDIDVFQAGKRVLVAVTSA